MMDTKFEWRDVFLKQPALLFFLDTSRPMNYDTFEDICSVLNNTIGLAAAIKGSSRLSAFGFYLLSENVECVFLMQSMKQNFSKLCQSLENVKNSTMILGRKFCDGEKFTETIREAIQQYEKHFQGLLMKQEDWPLLQLVIVSPQPLKKFSRIVQHALPKDKLTLIHKVQIMGIATQGLFSNTYEEDLDEPDDEGSSEAKCLSSSNESSSGDSVQALVEVIHLGSNTYMLERMLKSYIQDFTADSDHLRIQIKQDELVLRCDMHECMINPDCLPGNSNFCLNMDAGFTQMIMPNRAKQGSAKVPVYCLEALGLVPKAGICESVLYGQPISISPTACWKLNWDVLKIYEHKFQATNKYLLDHKLTLIMKKQSQELSTQNTNPSGYFVLFPTEQKSIMLVKSIVSKEHWMPTVPPKSVDESVPADIMLNVKRCFEQLDIHDVFNPLCLSSGLFEHLAITQGKFRPPKAKNSKVLTNVVRPIQHASPDVYVPLPTTMASYSTSETTKAITGDLARVQESAQSKSKKASFGLDFMKASLLLKKKFPTNL